MRLAVVETDPRRKCKDVFVLLGHAENQLALSLREKGVMLLYLAQAYQHSLHSLRLKLMEQAKSLLRPCQKQRQPAQQHRTKRREKARRGVEEVAVELQQAAKKERQTPRREGQQPVLQFSQKFKEDMEKAQLEVSNKEVYSEHYLQIPDPKYVDKPIRRKHLEEHSKMEYFLKNIVETRQRPPRSKHSKNALILDEKVQIGPEEQRRVVVRLPEDVKQAKGDDWDYSVELDSLSQSSLQALLAVQKQLVLNGLLESSFSRELDQRRANSSSLYEGAYTDTPSSHFNDSQSREKLFDQVNDSLLHLTTITQTNEVISGATPPRKKILGAAIAGMAREQGGVLALCRSRGMTARNMARTLYQLLLGGVSLEQRDTLRFSQITVR